MNNHNSIRYNINLAIIWTLVAVAIVFGSILAIYENSRYDSNIKEIIVTLNEITAQHSESLGNEIFSNQILALEETMNELIDERKIFAICTYNDSGEALVCTKPSLLKPLTQLQQGSISTGPITKLGYLGDHPTLSYTNQIIAYGEKVGYWQLHYSIEYLQEQIQDVTLIFTASILSFSAILIWLINGILIRFFLTPLQVLHNTMQLIQDPEEVKSNNVKENRIDKMLRSFDKLPYALTPSNDTKNEISSLSYSFQQMLLALKRSYTDIRTDNLTSLANRLKLDESIQSGILMEQRYLHPFSIILIDIDFFKQINDSYGHLIGDDVLIALASLFEQNVRVTDVVGRWGGEEFLIFLPKQNLDQAEIVAENLRKKVESTPFPTIGHLTLSFGVAQYNAKETADALIQRADIALYRAKELGRNRVELNK